MKILAASVLASIIGASTYVQGFALPNSLQPLAARSLDQGHQESGAIAAFDISKRSDGDLHWFEKRVDGGGRSTRSSARKKKHQSSEDSEDNLDGSMRQRERRPKPKTKRRKKYETSSKSESEESSSSEEEQSVARGPRRQGKDRAGERYPARKEAEKQERGKGRERERERNREREAARRAEIRQGNKKEIEPQRGSSEEREAARRAEIREGKKRETRPQRGSSEEKFELSAQAEKLSLRTKAKSPKDSSPEPENLEKVGYKVRNEQTAPLTFEISDGPKAAKTLNNDLNIDFRTGSWFETKIYAGGKADALQTYTDAASRTFMVGSKYKKEDPIGKLPMKELSHQAMLNGLKLSNAYMAKQTRRWQPTQPEDMRTYGEIGVVNGDTVAMVRARRSKDGVSEGLRAYYGSNRGHFKQLAESDNGRAEFGMLRSRARSQGLDITGVSTYDFGDAGIMLFWHLTPANK